MLTVPVGWATQFDDEMATGTLVIDFESGIASHSCSLCDEILTVPNETPHAWVLLPNPQFDEWIHLSCILYTHHISLIIRPDVELCDSYRARHRK